MPLDACLTQYWKDGTIEHIVQAYWFPVCGWEHHARDGISQTFAMATEHSPKLPNDRDGSFAGLRFRFVDVALPHRMRDENRVITKVLPEHATNLTAPRSRESGHGHNRASGFSKNC